MEVFINCEYGCDDVKDLPIEELALFVLEKEKQPSNAEVSINFVGNDEIHVLNRDFRNIDRPTDVLSFECDGFDDEMSEIEGDVFELGDIVIAPDMARDNISHFATSLDDEILLLLTHGLLHLCGYDHMQDDEAEVMEERERVLLSEFLGREFVR